MLCKLKGRVTMLRYVKPERIFIRNHPQFDERWVQDRIAEDPSLLGLGDLVLKDKERIQPRAGRLDLLLQDPDANNERRRFRAVAFAPFGLVADADAEARMAILEIHTVQAGR